jgi:ABC-type nitrate/sulfonate/bicarbonate transport system substrate-binding protein
MYFYIDHRDQFEEGRMSAKDVWYTRCPVPTALGLAIRLDELERDLERRGVTVHSLQRTVDRDVRQSHFTHSLDRSIRHGGNTPAIFARSEGADTKVVALSWTDTPHLILSLADSGVRSVADLKGRRIAITKRENDVIDFWRAAALRTFEVALASEGLSLSDVELVTIPVGRSYLDDGRLGPSATNQRLTRGGGLQREEIFALIRGEADAIYSQSSFGIDVKNFLGAHVVYDAGKHPDALARANNALPEAFTISRSLIEDDLDIAAQIVAHSIAAADWARGHVDETIRFVAAEQGVSEDTVRQGYGAVLAEQLDIDLSELRVNALKARKDFLLSHGFIRTDFDVDDWIDARPLNRARELLASGAIPLPGTRSPSAAFVPATAVA